jgi:hypothetical protein
MTCFDSDVNNYLPGFYHFFQKNYKFINLCDYLKRYIYHEIINRTKTG